MCARHHRPLTVLSAFTGAGGLDLGLESAGFDTVACIELDCWARETIITNRPHWNLLKTGDIVAAAYQLRPAALGLAPRELSVLAGGPPCQPFSTAAQWVETSRRGINDERSLGLLAFLHLAEVFLPHVILIENVPGFVLGRSSATRLLEDEFARINLRNRTAYRVDYRIISAEEYGIPQRRRRAIMVARRDGETFNWPEPTHKENPICAYDALWDVSPVRVPRLRGQWRDLLPTIPAGKNYQFHTSSGPGYPIFGYRTRFWSFLLKLAPHEPAWTIPAQAGPSTGPFHWENRPLAIEELARLQSFPSEWRFEGGDIAQRKQIGNATPPLMSEIFGRAIAKSVFGFRPVKRLKLGFVSRPVVPAPPGPTTVPARFLSNLVPAPHPGVGHGPGVTSRRKAALLTEFVVGLHARYEQIERDASASAHAFGSPVDTTDFEIAWLGSSGLRDPGRSSPIEIRIAKAQATSEDFEAA
jgi:DNA (cytosine-5)-methyltransferase 1